MRAEPAHLHPGVISQIAIGTSGAALMGLVDATMNITAAENPLFLYVGYIAWFAGSLLIYRFLRRPLLGRIVETLLVISGLLLATYFLARNKAEFIDWLTGLEQARVDSAKGHLYRAIHQATLPYNERSTRRMFIDDKHDYSRMHIKLYDVRRAGIMDYELEGQTLTYDERALIRFPFGANVELPFEAKNFLRVEDLRGVAPANIPFEIEAVQTRFKTFLYEARIPEFKGDLHYRRVFCHPSSQLFNPEAFLLFLDFFEGEIAELEINLFSDQPMTNVFLQIPDEYNPSNAQYTWKDRQLAVEESWITDPEVLSKEAQVAQEEWSEISGAEAQLQFTTGYKIRLREPERERFFLIYFKGETAEEKFL